MATNRASLAETAPSEMRGEEPTITRGVGVIGWCLVFVGVMFIVANRWFETPRLFGEPFGWVAVFFGLLMAFIHIATETDDLVKRALGVFGGALILAGIGWGLAMAIKGRPWSIGLVPALPGVLILALYGRKETEPTMRGIALYSIGVAGFLLVLVGILGAMGQSLWSMSGKTIDPIWFSGRWSPAMGLGLLFSLLFLGCAGSMDNFARRLAMALGIVGAFSVVASTAISALPSLFHDWREDPTRYEYAVPIGLGVVIFLISLAAILILGKPEENEAPTAANRAAQSWGRIGAIIGVLVGLFGVARYFAPNILRNTGWFLAPPKPFLFPVGMILIIVGLIAIVISLAFWSESRLVVMTRREFTAFFVSPVAYFVMIGFLMMAAVSYYLFVGQIQVRAELQQPMEEPIVQSYVIAFLPVVAVMFSIPLMTMRLFSEEKRSGTIEVLLTAPVGDSLVVLSKFLGAWFFFLILWIPWWLFLLALRLEGGQEFDFRPLIGFWLALAASGAAFVAMGLFFSSLSRDQMIAAALSFMGMMILISFLFIDRMLRGNDSLTVALRGVARAMSFVQMWIDATDGKLYLRDMVYQISATVFWLFMTVKVLEVRRWS